jgi:hypothetical protein
VALAVAAVEALPAVEVALDGVPTGTPFAMARVKLREHAGVRQAAPTSAYGKVTTPLLRELLRAAGLWPEAR